MPGADELFAGLARARRRVLGLWLGAFAAAAAGTAVVRLGGADRALLGASVRALDLTALAFAPAGTAARSPGALHPAVDLRFLPGAPEPR